MSKYLLIETRSIWDSQAVNDFLDMAVQLAKDGHTIDLFLIQNAVIMAKLSPDQKLSNLLKYNKISIWIDDFSLTYRTIADRDLVKGVRIGNMKLLVNLLTSNNCKILWH